MESTIGFISQLNSNGAAALASGNLDLAFESFSGALEMIAVFNNRDLLALQSPPTTGNGFNVNGAPKTNVSASGFYWESALHDAKIAHLHFVARNPSSNSVTTKFEHAQFVYQDAFVFNPSLFFSDHTATTYLPVCLAMIQFNLALTYQMKSEDIGETALTRAIYWYDMCLWHVQQMVHLSMPGYLNIVVAAMNNMAVASYDLCHYSRTRQIIGTLMDLVSSQNVNERSKLFNEEDMQEVLLNIMMLHANAIAPAA